MGFLYALIPSLIFPIECKVFRGWDSYMPWYLCWSSQLNLNFSGGETLYSLIPLLIFPSQEGCVRDMGCLRIFLLWFCDVLSGRKGKPNSTFSGHRQVGSQHSRCYNKSASDFLDDDFMSGIAARSTLPEFAVPRCPTALSIKYHRLIGYQVDIGCPSNGHQHRQRHQVNLDQALAAFICTQTEGD